LAVSSFLICDEVERVDQNCGWLRSVAGVSSAASDSLKSSLSRSLATSSVSEDASESLRWIV